MNVEMAACVFKGPVNGSSNLIRGRSADSGLRETERETERERQKERDRDRDRERDRERGRDRERECCR